jgi:hypothetical protein
MQGSFRLGSAKIRSAAFICVAWLLAPRSRATIFTLPAGYRPPSVLLDTYANAQGRVDVMTDGKVTRLATGG